MSKKMKFSPLSFTFSEFSPVEHEEGEYPKFRGVAYTGDVIPQWAWYENIVVDLEGATFKDQVPILFNHDPERVAGKARFFVENNQVIAEGVIFTDEPDGERIKRLADKGHKWEMSIAAHAESVLVLGENEKKIVNGNVLEGQHYILQNPTLREASFCTFGADKNTSATLFSRFKDKLMGKEEETENIIELDVVTLNEKEDENMEKELKELQEKNVELTSKLDEATAKLEEANKKLSEIEEAARKVEVEAKFTEEYEVSEEDKEMLTAAFMSGDEKQIKMAEKLLAGMKKVEAPKTDALPNELFAAESGEDESLKEIASSKRDLFELGQELAEKEGIPLTTAIAKVRKAQVG